MTPWQAIPVHELRQNPVTILGDVEHSLSVLLPGFVAEAARLEQRWDVRPFVGAKQHNAFHRLSVWSGHLKLALPSRSKIN